MRRKRREDITDAKKWLERGILMNQFQLGNGVIVSGNKVWVDGKELPLVPVKSPHSITQIDNKVYIDGFEFKNGKWRRTIKAIWHLLF